MILITAVSLAACGGDDTEETQAAAAPSAAPAPSPQSAAPPAPSPQPSTVANKSPVVSGSAPSTVMQGTAYDFTPTASDGDGDILTFSIEGRPPWAAFSTATGRLSGTPGPGDVGTYSNIRIRVTDGAATSSLAAFSIDVVGIATGSVTLTWAPPTANSDGTPLSDLAGYKIYWGRSAGNYTSSVTLPNPGLSSYVVEQLTPATWFFAATSYNSQGVESQYSNEASKTVL